MEKPDLIDESSDNDKYNNHSKEKQTNSENRSLQHQQEKEDKQTKINTNNHLSNINTKIGDKLEYLFEKQRILIEENYDTLSSLSPDRHPPEIRNNMQEQNNNSQKYMNEQKEVDSQSLGKDTSLLTLPDILTQGTEISDRWAENNNNKNFSSINKSIETRTLENKMQKIYQTKEPFSGYRIFMLASAILHETVELQRETNWKWWKTSKEINEEKIQEEIIDIWHFLIQISIEAGLDPDKLISKYIDKNRENSNRQLRGY